MNSLNPMYVTDEKGKRISVILSLEEYESLLENLHDLSIIAKRRNETTISLDELTDLITSH